MEQIKVPAEEVLEAVAQQRNAALNDVAILQVRVAQLEAEAKQKERQGADVE